MGTFRAEMKIEGYCQKHQPEKSQRQISDRLFITVIVGRLMTMLYESLKIITVSGTVVLCDEMRRCFAIRE